MNFRAKNQGNSVINKRKIRLEFSTFYDGQDVGFYNGKKRVKLLAKTSHAN